MRYVVRDGVAPVRLLLGGGRRVSACDAWRFRRQTFSVCDSHQLLCGGALH